jgi:RNA polymerase sigma-70 factor (ECF subfamily)
MMINPGTQELIIELKKGNLEALGLLYDRYRQMVYHTALAITGDPEAASDLLQDVFLRLYRFAQHIDSERPLEPWLYRMTANLTYTWIKRNRRWIHSLEDWAEWLTGMGRQNIDDIVEKNDDWQQVHNAVARLPFQQRVVVVLYFLDDLSIQEIAEILEVPAGTIKSRLHYGRIALRKSLGADGFVGREKLHELNYKNL